MSIRRASFWIRLGVAVSACAAVATVSPSFAATPAVGDVTGATGFAGSSPNFETRTCTGTVAVAPTATVTTLPPSTQEQNVAFARSTCAGTLSAGTWYSGAATLIDIGFYRNGVSMGDTRCWQDECTASVPPGTAASPVSVVVDFHWALADGAWNVQEPGSCAAGVDGSPLTIRCTDLTVVRT